MDKSWDQLSDRCNLFFKSPDGLYIELLKEAECELFYKIKKKARSWIAIDSAESWVTEFDFVIYPSFYIGLEDVPKSIIKSGIYIILQTNLWLFCNG